jgi:hypothetical protein
VPGIHDNVFVFFDDVDNMQLDPELFRNPERIVALWSRTVFLANGMRVSFDTETGVKIYPLDVDTLIQDYFGRQQGIQTARYQGNGFARCIHTRHWFYDEVSVRHSNRWGF